MTPRTSEYLFKTNADLSGLDQYKRALDGLVGTVKGYGKAEQDVIRNARQATAAQAQTVAGLEKQRQLWEQVRRNVASTNPAFREAIGNIQRLDRQLDQLNRTQSIAAGVRGGLQSFAAGLLPGLGVAAAGAFASQQIGASVQEGLGLEAAQRRIRLLSEGYDDYARVLAQSEALSQKFNQSQREGAEAFSQVYARLRPVGLTLEQVSDVYDGFNTAVKLSGTNATEANAAFLQLSQALGSGVLRGEELNSVYEQTPAVVREIAEVMEIPIGQVREYAKEGKITADIVVTALQRIKTEGADQLADAMDSPREKLRRLQADWQDFQAAMGNAIIPAIVDSIDAVKSITEATSRSVSDLGTAFDNLRASSGVIDWLADRFGALGRRILEARREALMLTAVGRVGVPDGAGLGIVPENPAEALFVGPALPSGTGMSAAQKAYMDRMRREGRIPATPLPVVPSPPATSGGGGGSRGGSKSAKDTRSVLERLGITKEELVAAAITAIGEYSGPDPLGRTDVFANILARRQSAQFPSNLVDVVMQRGQYAPNFGRSRSQITSEAYGAATYGSLFYQAMQELQNVALLRKSIQDVNGRLYFKGETQYPNMMSGDFLRAPGQNFFHGPGRALGVNPGITQSLLGMLAGAEGGDFSALAKLADEAERKNKADEEAFFNATRSLELSNARLAILKEQDPFEKARLQYELKSLETQQKYNDLIAKVAEDNLPARQAIDAERVNALKMDEIEYQKTLAKLNAEHTEEFNKQVQALWQLLGLSSALSDQFQRGMGRAFASGAPQGFSIQDDILGSNGLADARGEAAKDLQELISPLNQTVALSNALGESFGEATRSIVTGSQTMRDTLANLFDSIASHFADMAARIIADYTRMQVRGIIGNLIPGLGSVASPGVAAATAIGGTGSFLNAFSGSPFPNTFGAGGLSIPGFAGGGIARGPSSGYLAMLHGDEMVMPLSKMMGSGSMTFQLATYEAGNGQQFVTLDQVENMVLQMNETISRQLDFSMLRSPGTRARWGI